MHSTTDTKLDNWPTGLRQIRKREVIFQDQFDFLDCKTETILITQERLMIQSQFGKLKQIKCEC